MSTDTSKDVLCSNCTGNVRPEAGVMIERKARVCRHWTHGAHEYCRACACSLAKCQDCGASTADKTKK